MKTKIITVVCLFFLALNLQGQEQKLKFFNTKNLDGTIVLTLKTQRKLPKGSKRVLISFTKEKEALQLLQEICNEQLASYKKEKNEWIAGVFKIDNKGKLFDVEYYLKQGNKEIPEEALFAIYNKLMEINWLEYAKAYNDEKDFDYMTFMYGVSR